MGDDLQQTSQPLTSLDLSDPRQPLAPGMDLLEPPAGSEPPGSDGTLERLRQLEAFYTNLQLDNADASGAALPMQTEEPLPGSGEWLPLLDSADQLEPAPSLVVIDQSVADWRELVLSAPQDAELLVLEQDRDGVNQISKYLSQELQGGHPRYSSIAIVSEGRQAEVLLGSSSLSATTLSTYQEQLSSWGAALTNNADILLFGCNVAQGVEGEAFVRELAALTQADLAASDDLTGRQELGGDLELEIEVGQVEIQREQLAPWLLQLRQALNLDSTPENTESPSNSDAMATAPETDNSSVETNSVIETTAEASSTETTAVTNTDSEPANQPSEVTTPGANSAEDNDSTTDTVSINSDSQGGDANDQEPTTIDDEEIREQARTDLFQPNSSSATLTNKGQQALDEAIRQSQAAIEAQVQNESFDDIIRESIQSHSTNKDARESEISNLSESIATHKLTINLEVRSELELPNIQAAYILGSSTNTPRIILNRALVEGLDTSAIARAITEELGHAIDEIINGESDSLGDEGERFAAALFGAYELGREESDTLSEDDSIQLWLDGQLFEAESASITFAALYSGTASSPDQEANEISSLTQIQGSKFKFTSLAPGDPYFSGNNVTGDLSYINSSGTAISIRGVVSRLVKTGSQVEGLYFYAFGPNGTIGQSGDPDSGEGGYVLLLNSSYAIASTERTSSDPVDSALNAEIVPNAAPTTNDDTLTIKLDSSGNGSGSGNVLTNDSDSNNDTLTVTSFSIAGQLGTFTLGSNYTITGVGTVNLSSDGSYTFTAENGQTGTVPTITYTASDGSLTSSANLHITVNAANEPPVAIDDYSTINWSSGGSITGNAKTNDSDPDGSGDFSLSRVSAGTSLGAGGATIYSLGGGTNPLTESNAYQTFEFSRAQNLINNATAGSTISIYGDGITSGTTPITGTVTSVTGTGGYRTVTVRFDNSKAAAISTSSSLYADVDTANTFVSLTPTSVLDVSTSWIAVQDDNSLSQGLGINGTNVAGGTTIADVINTNGPKTLIRLSTALSGLVSNSVPSDLEYTTPSQTTVAGTYGSLTINSNGTYTYTLTTDAATAAGNTDSFTYEVKDSENNTDTALISIAITSGVQTTLTVTGSNVNEASDYIVYTVAGSANQAGITLEVSQPASNFVSIGTDIAENIEVSTNGGSSWSTYSGTPLTADSNGEIFVRAAITQDKIFEGTESLVLTATNSSGVSTSATSTISDDGSGSLLTGSITSRSFALETGEAPDFDNPTMDNIQVNEGSQYAVFTINGVGGQEFNLALADAKATSSGATQGTELDYSTNLEFWNGSSWQAYSSGTPITVPGSSGSSEKLFIRHQIYNEAAVESDNDVYEGAESYLLTATDTTGNSITARSTIFDDGTGDLYTGNINANSAEKDTVSSKDFDSSVEVTGYGAPASPGLV